MKQKKFKKTKEELFKEIADKHKKLQDINNQIFNSVKEMEQLNIDDEDMQKKLSDLIHYYEDTINNAFKYFQSTTKQLEIRLTTINQLREILKDTQQSKRIAKIAQKINTVLPADTNDKQLVNSKLQAIAEEISNCRINDQDVSQVFSDLRNILISVFLVSANNDIKLFSNNGIEKMSSAVIDIIGGYLNNKKIAKEWIDEYIERINKINTWLISGLEKAFNNDKAKKLSQAFINNRIWQKIVGVFNDKWREVLKDKNKQKELFTYITNKVLPKNNIDDKIKQIFIETFERFKEDELQLQKYKQKLPPVKTKQTIKPSILNTKINYNPNQINVNRIYLNQQPKFGYNINNRLYNNYNNNNINSYNNQYRQNINFNYNPYPNIYQNQGYNNFPQLQNRRMNNK